MNTANLYVHISSSLGKGSEVSDKYLTYNSGHKDARGTTEDAKEHTLKRE